MTGAFAMLDEPFFVRALLAGLGIAVAAGPIGCFVVWRRMAYFGESLAHAGLLGVAVGLALGVDITIGVIVAALAMAALLTGLRAQRLLPTDSLLGILSHTALALGLVAASLMTWVRDRLSAGASIQVVGDQVRTPTYAGDLARGIGLLLESGEQGVFHMSGADVLTPWDMAVRTARRLGLDESLMRRVDASTFTQPARRPQRTGFVIDKARRVLGYEPLSFEEGLARCFASSSE